MWSNWPINWKTLKTKLVLFTALIGIFLTMTGFSSPNIKDNSNLLERETSKLILAKNDRYFQTSEQPQIIVKTEIGRASCRERV